MQLCVASTMLDEHGNLPEGWKYSSKEVTQYQWACPNPSECKKYKVLTYKETRCDALAYGSYHLYNKKLHADYDWNQACSAAEADISQIQRNKQIVLDENGTEQYLQKYKEKEPDADKGSGPVNSAQPKWQAGSEWGGRKRSRNELEEHCSETPQTPLTPHPPQSPPSSAIQTFVQEETVHMTKVELDHLIDGIERAVDSCDFCAQYAKQAASVIENTAKALKDCKHQFERWRRM